MRDVYTNGTDIKMLSKNRAGERNIIFNCTRSIPRRGYFMYRIRVFFSLQNQISAEIMNNTLAPMHINSGVIYYAFSAFSVVRYRMAPGDMRLPSTGVFIYIYIYACVYLYCTDYIM